MNDVIHAEAGEHINDFCRRLAMLPRTHTIIGELNGTQFEVRPNEPFPVLSERWGKNHSKRTAAQEAHASKIKQLEAKVIHAACCWRELPVGGANAEKMLINAVDAYEEALRGG